MEAFFEDDMLQMKCYEVLRPHLVMRVSKTDCLKPRGDSVAGQSTIARKKLPDKEQSTMGDRVDMRITARVDG